MSKKQKTMNGYRQKMRKYLEWARSNAPELYEEVWGRLQAHGAVTPDDLTMVPSEVLIAEHDKLREIFQIFVQAREEEKQKEVVSVVSNPGPTSVPEEPQLQRQQVEERASKLLARIEDKVARDDVSEEILTALLVNNWSEIPVQALKSMVDVLERELDEANRQAKSATAKENEAKMWELAEEDRIAETGQVLEVAPSPSVQAEEVPEAIVSVTPSSPTLTTEVAKEELKRKFIPRSEWPRCDNPDNNPDCMGQRAPLRDRSGFYEVCASCHRYARELESAVPAVVDGVELRVQEEVESEAVQCELLAALELKAEELGLFTPGVKGYITKLLNDETKGIRAAIDYLIAKVDPEVSTEVEVNLQLVETKVVEVETAAVEDGFRFCQHCNREKPADTFRMFEDRYPWLPKGHGILNWVGAEVCARCVFDLSEAAQKLKDGKAKCPRCGSSVSFAKRKAFEVRHPIPKDHPIRRQWEGKRLCWGCINELAREVYEASQELAAKAIKDESPPKMSNEEWESVLTSFESHSEVPGAFDEPLLDEERGISIPQRARQRVIARAVA